MYRLRYVTLHHPLYLNISVTKWFKGEQHSLSLSTLLFAALRTLYALDRTVRS
jgi:hypothetical protein